VASTGDPGSLTPTTYTSPGRRTALRSVLAAATVIALAVAGGAQVVKRSLNELVPMDPDIREIVTEAGRKNVLGLASSTTPGCSRSSTR
jgi:hypothetical protein